MLHIKIVYNNKTFPLIEPLTPLKINPMFEFFNEDEPKDLKNCFKYKGAGGAREVPYIGCYEDTKLIKAFYAEDKSSKPEIFKTWLQDYIKEHAKSGYMTITKIEGSEERYSLGATHRGYTDTFIEGASLRLDSTDRWFHTSIVKSIDWDKKIFKTLNSTYSFILNEQSNDNNARN